MSLFSVFSRGLKKTRENMKAGLDALFSGNKIDEELFEELEETLILADVGAATAALLCENLRKKAKEQKITEPAALRQLLVQEIAQMLGDPAPLNLNTKPSVLVVIGVNGAGKTTAIGKLSHRLQAQGKQVLLGAADTFRAAAIDQLGVWARRAGVPMIAQKEGADPAAVVFDAIAAAKARGVDVCICDTAGRLHNKQNLMAELEKILRVIHREAPDADVETLLVLDATTGQNAVSQAKLFHAATPISGIVLTKLDGTAKGGIVLAIRQELGIPVKLIGTGEGIDDIHPFDPKAFAAGLFSESEEATEE